MATAMAILRCFTLSEPLQGVVEIAEQVGLHKSSVSRMLSTLEAEELVEQDPISRKYRLGLGLLQVAGPLLAGMDVRRAALPVLRDFANAQEETFSLLLWDGHGAVTVEQAPSPRAVKHSVDLGTRYARVENASTRLFVRSLAPAEQEKALAHLDSNAEALMRLSVDDDEHTTLNLGQSVEEEIGIAAPVHDHRGEMIAVVLVAAPRFRIGAERIPALREATAQAARTISARLGWAP